MTATTITTSGSSNNFLTEILGFVQKNSSCLPYFYSNFCNIRIP